MTPDPKDERRKAQRLPYRGEIEFWIDSVQGSGYYTDISTIGIYIETLNPAEPGKRCTMRFTIPGYSETIEAEGIVMWNNVPMGMGVEFVSLTRDAHQAIRELTAEKPAR